MATLASPLATPRLAPSMLALSGLSPGLPRPALTRPESQIMYYLKAIATFSKLSSSASSQNLVLERSFAKLGRIENATYQILNALTIIMRSLKSNRKFIIVFEQLNIGNDFETSYSLPSTAQL